MAVVMIVQCIIKSFVSLNISASVTLEAKTRRLLRIGHPMSPKGFFRNTYLAKPFAQAACFRQPSNSVGMCANRVATWVWIVTRLLRKKKRTIGAQLPKRGRGRRCHPTKRPEQKTRHTRNRDKSPGRGAFFLCSS